MDRSDYNVVGFWDVLRMDKPWSRRVMSGARHRCHTLPLLFSTQMAFFLLSTRSGPASTGVMVEGGTWRRPGPSLRAADGLDGTGKTSEGSLSPGRTSVDIARRASNT